MATTEIKASNLEVGEAFRLKPAGHSFLALEIDEYVDMNKIAVKVEGGRTIHLDMGSTVYVPHAVI